MLTLPDAIVALLVPFATLFTSPTWRKAQVLLIGAILTPGQLTVLAPSTRYYQQQGRQHKKLTDWARQMVMQLRRWLPHRPLVLVGDNGSVPSIGVKARHPF